MDIYWLGQACLKLKGKNAQVVIDPFDPTFTGLKLPKDLSADIVLSTHEHQDHNNTDIVTTPTGSGKPMEFKEPGEYEVAGVVITAIDSFHDNSNGSERGKNTIFHLNLDGLNIVHLGDLGQAQLTEEQVAQIGQTDVLLTPVGSVYTIDGKQAATIVAQLEPKIVIPMHYKIEGLKFELEGMEKFLKEMGAEGVTAQPKLSITKEKLPEEPQVVVLTKS
ncbi:MBL fold metallo-hydrolase [Candidatus Daviesbacteria bacterium]|nr:MBL fold metallo-hydrolase [Candidatus Daviesbacteria bacterium]